MTRAIEWAKGFERGRKNGVEDAALGRALWYGTGGLEDEQEYVQGYVHGYNRGVQEGMADAMAILGSEV